MRRFGKFTSVIIWTFALSAFFVVFENLHKEEKHKETPIRYSLGTTAIGFAVIDLDF